MPGDSLLRRACFVKTTGSSRRWYFSTRLPTFPLIPVAMGMNAWEEGSRKYLCMSMTMSADSDRANLTFSARCWLR
jgi:hypothetical protein